MPAVPERVAGRSSHAARAVEPKSDAPPPRRLVIRVKIVREEPPPPRVSRHLKRGALVSLLGVLAIGLTWVGISTLRKAPAPAPMVAESVPSRRSQIQTPPPIPAPAEPAKAVEPESEEQSNAPPSAIAEVIPDVPRSARETIRGTVRVSVRVILDEDGTVLAATADDAGPSRYFERLAVEAARKWTFTPAKSQEQRVMLVRFNFRRDGTTARASTVP